PLRQGIRYVPSAISERWPEIQRIPLVEAEWTNLPKAELKEKANALRRQIVGNILPSGAAIYAAELEAERQRAERALTAESRFIAQAAQNELERGDYGTALALAIEALPSDVFSPNRPYVVEVERALHQIFQHNIKEHYVLRGHEAQVLSAVFSPDGAR